MVNVHHSPEFFEQMRSCREAYRRLADCFHNLLVADLGFGRPNAVRTVLDIGCGTGAQTARLAELGWTAVGADVFDVAPEPGFAFRKVDLLEERASFRYDTVLCTETAEHVAPERANDLVAAVAGRASRLIVWSAAVPGQEWEGHVNLQPHSYWLERFALLDWHVQMGKTLGLRGMIVATAAQHWMADGNFYVLGPGGAR